MLKVLLSIKNGLDGFDSLGDRGLVGRIIQSVIVIFGLGLFCVILPGVFGFTMLNFPRFFSFLILAFFIISIVTLILTPFLIEDLVPKRISDEVLVTSFLFSILVTIVLFYLWWFGGMGLMPKSTQTRFFPPKTQFPLGDLNGIAVDKKGHLYLCILGYSRIQQYNNEGVFLKGWFTNAWGGLFDIWIDDKDNLNVRATRADEHLIFNADGQLLKTTKIASPEENEYLAQQASGLRAKDSLGNIYKIENRKWSPKVIKINSIGEKSILIKDNAYFYLFRCPQPLLVVMSVISVLMGMLMPVLGKARQHAKMIIGVSNQQQILYAVNFFAFDNDERYPESVAKTGFDENWNWQEPLVLVSTMTEAVQPYRAVSEYLKSYIKDTSIMFCPNGPRKYKYLQQAWDAGDNWNHPDTWPREDWLKGTYCFYWNYTGLLDDRLFRGPSNTAGGGWGRSKLLMSCYLGYDRFLSPGSFGSCESFGKTSVTIGEPSSLDYWSRPASENFNLDTIDVKLHAAYTDGHVESYSASEVVSMWVVMDRFTNVPYNYGPGVFCLPRNGL